MTRIAVNRQHLEEAHRQSRLPISLDAALQTPALALALLITAETIARPRPARAPMRRRVAKVIDFQKVRAGDID